MALTFTCFDGFQPKVGHTCQLMQHGNPLLLMRSKVTYQCQMSSEVKSMIVTLWLHKAIERGEEIRELQKNCLILWCCQSWSLIWGIQILLTTHTETNANKVCLGLWGITPGLQYIHTWNYSYLHPGKSWIPPSGVPCQDKDRAGSGILVYIYGLHTLKVRPIKFDFVDMHSFSNPTSCVYQMRKHYCFYFNFSCFWWMFFPTFFWHYVVENGSD